MFRLARQGRATFATWAMRADGVLRPSLAGVKSRSVVAACRSGSELPAVAVPRRRGSKGLFQGKGVVAHRHVATWMWSCRSSFRQAIVMAEVRTGRVVARGCRRRRSFAVVPVPSQRRSFLRMVASEAFPGVRSSHRLQPGGAQRSWNDVRRCRAVLAAVPSSPWPPQRRTSIPRRPESSSFRSKVLDSLLFDGSAAPRRSELCAARQRESSSRCPGAGKRRSG
jgi:hypothetical protein